MDALPTDVGYALRQLLRRPGFALVLAVTLALGIGATTAVFSVVHGVLLRPLPYDEPDELHVLWTQFPSQDLMRFPASWPEYADYRDANASFEQLAGYVGGSLTLTGRGSPARLPVAYATWSLFPVLGVDAAHGRVFDRSEDTPEGDPVVVLSHGLWRRTFGEDPGVVGMSVELDGTLHRVVGVMPAGFAFPEPEVEAWLPLGIDEADPPGRGNHFLRIIGRRAPGTSAAAAETELAGLVSRGQDDHALGHAWSHDNHPAYLRSLHEDVVGDVRRPLLVLLGAVGLVLLIACVNVANLLLVRGEGRLRELSIRSALGAGRRRLVRQLLTESVVMALLGGAAGVALAWLGVRGLLAVAPEGLPRTDAVGLSWPVLAFSAGVTLLAGLAFGVAPALQVSRLDVQRTLREEGRGGTRGGERVRLRQLLVVGETALAVVLLVSAGLLARSFWSLRSVDPGFEAERVLAVRTSLPSTTYPEPADVTGFYDRLVERLGAVPGVTTASAARVAPLAGSLPPNDIQIEGMELVHGEGPVPNADVQVVSAGYFTALGIPVLEGRAFDERDGSESPVVAVVSAAMARTFWPEGGPHGSPLGWRIRQSGGDREWAEIVGVVGDVRQEGLNEDVRGTLYFLHAQSPRAWYPVRAMTLLLRTGLDPDALIPAVRREVEALDPELALYETTTLERTVARSTATPRFAALLQVVFSAVALLLAAVGIYGVLSHTVASRTQELGIRMALGADRGRIMGLVMGQGMLLVAVALVLGTVGALMAGRLLGSLLFGVSATDPLTYGAVILLLGAVGALACLVPGLRAARSDPSEALRAE